MSDRMILLQHARRRRGVMGDAGIAIIGAARYQLDEDGRVWVLPEHAELALQGAAWTAANPADVSDSGSAADVERKLRDEVKQLRDENAELRKRLLAFESASTPAPAPAPAPARSRDDLAPATGSVAPEPGTKPDAFSDDLETKTRDELATMAEELALDVPKSASKVKLLSVIRAAFAEGE